MPADLKAPARECRGCGGEIPAQPSAPGRPREFCTRDCRSGYHRRKERAEIERERREARERDLFELDVRWYGIREARRRAKERGRSRP